MHFNRFSLELSVVNPYRIFIFFLLFVELFLIQTWLIPSPWHLVAIAECLIALFVAVSIPRFRGYLEYQIFDRIRMTDHGVEYTSGIFGDSWLRPYNEFRIEVRKTGWRFPRFRVWLKHRVLPNTVIQSTFDAVAAENTARNIVENSRLTMLRR